MRRLRKLGVNTASSNAEKTDESDNQKRIDETSINNNCTFVAEKEIQKDDNKNTIISGKNKSLFLFKRQQ